MRPEEAAKGMADDPCAELRLQETVAAVAGVLGKAVARRDRVDVVPEQPAQVADLLPEQLTIGEGINPLGLDERMRAPDADIFAHSVAIRESGLGMLTQTTGERVPDVGGG